MIKRYIFGYKLKDYIEIVRSVFVYGVYLPDNCPELFSAGPSIGIKYFLELQKYMFFDL